MSQLPSFDYPLSTHVGGHPNCSITFNPYSLQAFGYHDNDTAPDTSQIQVT